MCRGKQRCSEFGEREAWSRHAPLQPPHWFRDEIAAFGDAARLAANGDVPAARARFSATREAEARDWFVEHGQVSNYHRTRVLGTPRRSTPSSARRAPTPDAVKRRVWARDHYQCRYCGLPTIPDEVREALRQVVGESAIPWGATNASRHGIALVARTEYDHVDPVSLGGTNDETNLVTACPGCNYGKHSWTVAELGLEDPRARPPEWSAWDGLTSLVPALQARVTG